MAITLCKSTNFIPAIPVFDYVGFSFQDFSEKSSQVAGIISSVVIIFLTTQIPEASMCYYQHRTSREMQVS